MRLAYVSADPGVPVFGRKGCSVHVQEVVRGPGRKNISGLECAQMRVLVAVIPLRRLERVQPGQRLPAFLHESLEDGRELSLLVSATLDPPLRVDRRPGGTRIVQGEIKPGPEILPLFVSKMTDDFENGPFSGGRAPENLFTGQVRGQRPNGLATGNQTCEELLRIHQDSGLRSARRFFRSSRTCTRIMPLWANPESTARSVALHLHPESVRDPVDEGKVGGDRANIVDHAIIEVITAELVDVFLRHCSRPERELERIVENRPVGRIELRRTVILAER